MSHECVIELARFKVDPRSEEAFLAARPAMVEASLFVCLGAIAKVSHYWPSATRPRTLRGLSHEPRAYRCARCLVD
jgi:hypothetical protein